MQANLVAGTLFCSVMPIFCNCLLHNTTCFKLDSTGVITDYTTTLSIFQLLFFYAHHKLYLVVVRPYSELWIVSCYLKILTMGNPYLIMCRMALGA
jgi:hypothetical protein